MRSILAMLPLALTLAACRDGDAGRTSEREGPVAPAGEQRSAGGAAAPAEDRAGTAGSVAGTVASASADRLVVQPREGEPVTLRIVAGIPITVHGRVTASTEIPEGDAVEATYTFEEGERRAVRIVVGPPSP